LLIAHGLRRGVFGKRQLDDLIGCEGISFKCDPAWNDAPVFAAGSSRMALGENPMMDWSANLELKTAMQKYGISSGDSKLVIHAVADVQRLPTQCMA